MIALVAMAIFLFILIISPREEEIAFSNSASMPPSAKNIEPLPEESPTVPSSPDMTSASGDKTVTVHLVGAVAKPGIVLLAEGTRVFEAIQEAGGFTRLAAPEALNLAEPVIDGAQIRVPTKAEAQQLTADAAVGQQGPTQQGHNDKQATTPGKSTSVGDKINVNTADSVTLQQLQGVGPATAAKIIEHREQFGAFANPDELTAVQGIGPATVEKLRDQLNF